MKKGSVYGLFGIMAMVAVILNGCSFSNESSAENTPAGSTESGTQVSGGAGGQSTFGIRLTADPPSSDPKDFNSTTASLSFYNCYDTLLDFSADGTELEPALAESWEQKDDTTYVYKIRQGIKFSDGSDLTMEDVKFSLDRIKNPDTAASMSYLFDRVESFEITGDWELTVHLTEPDATWKYVPATSPCCIVSQKAVEAAGDKYGTAEGGCVGTGPYKFESWTSGSEITLVKNENWWGDKTKQLWDRVKYSIITDNTAAALAAQGGQLDYSHHLTSETYSIYEGIKNMNFYNYGSTTSNFLAFNCQKAPFDDVNFRKACAYAINKEDITSAIGGKYAHVSGGVPMPDTMFYMDPEAWKKADGETIEDYGYDLEKAKACLAESAYPDGADVTIYTTSTNKQLSEIIQADLKEIGVNVTVNEIQNSESYEISYGYKLDSDGKRLYDIYATGWLSDYLDPIGYLTPFWSNVNIREGGSNQAVYDGTEVQPLIDQSYLEKDDKVRSDLMIEAFTKAAEDCPYVTLYDYDETYALNKKYLYQEGPAFFWNFDLTDFALAR